MVILAYQDLRSQETTRIKKFYDTGLVLGAKFGAAYLLDQNNILEAGMKTDYTFYKADDISRIRESNIGLYVGYTYKF